MNYKKMLFKNNIVYILTDTSGQPIVKNGRASMKYNPADSKKYNPSINNITLLESKQSLILGDQQNNEILKTSSNAEIIAFTDGGCIGNPGPAGLGYLIVFPDGSKIQKGEPLGAGTNNIAELTAIKRVLQNISSKDIPVNISTDSSYSIGVLIMGWKAKVNKDLIAEIKKIMSTFTKITLIKVKGHAGHPENELVDKLANGAARTQKEQ